MEFNINKNGTLPLLKMQVVDDGRDEFDSFMSFIETSTIYFSMIDVETGSYKIHLEPAGFVEKTQIEPNAKTEYYIYYKFPKKYTSKVGRFEGEFVLKNTDGTLILPIREKLYINIGESNLSDDIDVNYNIGLIASISTGSTKITYTLTSNIPVEFNTTLNFTHTLNTYTGSSITITTGVTINSLQKIGSVSLILNDVDYFNLTQQSSFSNVSVSPVGLTNSVDITTESSFVQPGLTPTPTPTITETPNEPTPTPTVTETPTETPNEPTPTPTETPNEPTPTPTETEISNITPTPTQTPTPTPTEPLVGPTVYIDPVYGSGSSGFSFSLDIFLNNFNQDIAAISLIIPYDNTIHTPTDVTSILGGSFVYQIQPSEIIIYWFDINAYTPNPSIPIITITLQLGLGIDNYNFDTSPGNSEVGDINGDPILPITFSGSTIEGI